MFFINCEFERDLGMKLIIQKFFRDVKIRDFLFDMLGFSKEMNRLINL